MISIALFFLLQVVLCAADDAVDPNQMSKLAFSVPEYAQMGKISIHSAIFAISLLFIISFINIPNRSLGFFQNQAVVLLGVYLGACHILYTINILTSTQGIINMIVALGSLVAAVISYKDEFMLLFMAAISSYITTYYAVLVFGMENIIVLPILGGILFLFYLVIGRMKERLLPALSKAGVTSLGVIALIDTWGLISLFKGMHRIKGTKGVIYGFGIGGTIILITFTTVFAANYFPEWTKEKVDKLKGSQNSS